MTLFYYICQLLDSMAQKYNTTTIVKGIIIVLLLLCLIDADYGFYQAMRTLISFGFAFLTYRYYQSEDKTNAIIYLCLLIVFQPLLKIGLGRGIWIVADVAVAGFLAYQLYKEVFIKKTTIANGGKASIDNSLSTVKKQGNLRINFPDKEKR